MEKFMNGKSMGAALLAALLLGLLFSSAPASAGPASNLQRMGKSPTLVIKAEHVEGGVQRRVPAPYSLLRSPAQKTAAIQVTYVGAWDETAKAAFEFAKQVWETQITSTVTITVVAEWTPLGPSVLGSARAHDYLYDPQGTTLPHGNTWYPIGLANKLAGYDINDQDGYDSDLDGTDADPEIEARFNSAFSFGDGWYLGTDGLVGANQWDFVSVVLHELGHGLGFSGSMTVSGLTGSWGFNTGLPFIFDRFAVNNQGQRLLDTTLFPNGSLALGAQLIGGQVFFDGSQAMAANSGAAPRLYAPLTWQQGSSYSHFDEDTFAKGTADALMTPNLANGESIHTPGPITMGLFADLGWALAPPPPPPAEDFYAFLPFMINPLPAQ